ncbi:MAG: Rieske (2Fe-2S) protein [Planctomycetota bacterium]
MRWVAIKSVEEFPPDSADEFVIGTLVIAVFRVGDHFYALDGICAHQGGPIGKGEISKTDAGRYCVTCPWHGWQYELKTGIQTVNGLPLQATYETRVNEQQVEVRVPVG